jgi:hypothetical protein
MRSGRILDSDGAGAREAVVHPDDALSVRCVKD